MVGTTRRVVGLLATTGLLATAFASTASAQGSGVGDAAKTHDFSWGTFKLAQRIIDKAAAGTPLSIIVDNESPATPVFGAEQQIGTDRGCANNKTGLAATCALKGPPKADQTAQIAELDALLAADQVDCLGIESAILTRSSTRSTSSSMPASPSSPRTPTFPTASASPSTPSTSVTPATPMV